MANQDILGDNKIRDTLMEGMLIYSTDVREWCEEEFPDWPQPEEEEEE